MFLRPVAGKPAAEACRTDYRTTVCADAYRPALCAASESQMPESSAYTICQLPPGPVIPVEADIRPFCICQTATVPFALRHKMSEVPSPL